MFHYKNAYIQQYFNIDTNVLCDISEMNDKFKNQPTMNELMKNPGKVPFIDQQQKTKYYASPQTPMPKPNFVETNKILGR